MPDKDPQNYTGIQYAWVVGLAVWGGIVGHLQKIRQKDQAFRWAEVVSEILTSGLAGMLAFFICELAGLTGLKAAVLIAIAGYTGGEFVSLLKTTVYGRYGHHFTTESQKDEVKK